jgi:CubicO group peptidase (beta-lactamase class C family)
VNDLLERESRQLHGLVAAFRSRSRIPSVSVGVVIGDDLAWTYSVGHTDQASGRPADADTLYRIASVTKTFVATAIMQLRDEGRLSLEDPLVRHLPEFASAQNPFGPIEEVTLRRLLTHTAGLFRDPPLSDLAPVYWTPHTLEEVLGSLSRVRIGVPPGSRWKYSNLGATLLDEVVHRITGEPFGDYLRSEVTGPLGMGATDVAPSPTFVGRIAQGYDAATYTDVTTPSRDGADATDTGLWSSVNDMASWIAQQFRTGPESRRGPGQVLDGASLAEMHRPIVAVGSRLEEAQGLGWWTSRRGELRLIEHGGATPGFMSHVGFDPIAAFGIVVLLNGAGDTRRLLFDLAEIVAPLAARASLDRPAMSTAAVPETWLPLLGTYRQDDFNDQVRIEVRDGRLVVVTVGGADPPAPATPTADPSRFTLIDGMFIGEELRFVRDASGTVLRVIVGSEPFIRLEPVDQGNAPVPSPIRD